MIRYLHFVLKINYIPEDNLKWGFYCILAFKSIARHKKLGTNMRRRSEQFFWITIVLFFDGL